MIVVIKTFLFKDFTKIAVHIITIWRSTMLESYKHQQVTAHIHAELSNTNASFFCMMNTVNAFQ